MNQIERNTIKSVAKLAPWLAPVPSAFFVGRSAIAHLAVPLPVAVVIAAIVETLGLASVHTWLWLSDWNITKRKADPFAPVNVAVVLGGVYLVVTIGLTVALEILPSLATVAPALFPILAVVGAVNLALIAQQEQREATVNLERQERKAERQAKRQPTVKATAEKVSTLGENGHKMDAANAARVNTRQATLDTLVDILVDSPDAGVTDLARRVGRSRTAVYGYLDELESAGRIRRNGSGVEVL